MTRDVIQTAFDEFMKAEGFRKQSGSWHRSTSDVVTVANLQRSQYSPRYYVNIGLWLRELGDAVAPKENKCHVGIRIGQLLGAQDDAQVNSLLDLETEMPDDQRRGALLAMFGVVLRPALEAGESMETLRSPAGRRLREAALVAGRAQALLAQNDRRANDAPS